MTALVFQGYEPESKRLALFLSLPAREGDVGRVVSDLVLQYIKTAVIQLPRPLVKNPFFPLGGLFGALYGESNSHLWDAKVFRAVVALVNERLGSTGLGLVPSKKCGQEGYFLARQKK